MHIMENQNIHFNARNPKIRFADDLARKINQEYPRQSATKMECLKNAQNYPEAINDLRLSIRVMREDRKSNVRFFASTSELVERLFNTIKKHKKGNCGESAELTLISSKLNGIENCIKACIENPYGGDFDHAVVLVKDKKPYIIDAWLGFADYVPNAIKRYQGEFRKYFEFDQYGEKMLIKEDFHYLNEKIPPKELNKIKKNHPEVIICK